MDFTKRHLRTMNSGESADDVSENLIRQQDTLAWDSNAFGLSNETLGAGVHPPAASAAVQQLSLRSLHARFASTQERNFSLWIPCSE